MSSSSKYVTSSLALSLVLVCIFSLYFVVVRGLGDQHVSDFDTQFGAWKTEEVSEFDLGESVDWLVSFVPGNGAYAFNRARLYHNCSRGIGICEYSGEVSGQHALQSYQQAMELRPNWSKSFVYFAQLKFDIGEFDVAYDDAVKRAITLGRYEKSTLVLIPNIALSRWYHFNQAMRQSLADLVVDALSSRHKPTRNLANESLKTHFRIYQSQLDPVLVNSLFRWLSSRSRQHAHAKMGMLLGFWSSWDASQRVLLLPMITEFASEWGERSLLRIAKANRRLALACALLPKGELMDRECTNKRLKKANSSRKS